MSTLTTADLVNRVLRRSGELMSTEGTTASQYTTQALDHLNAFYKALFNGGNEFDVDFAEPWVWARSRRPIIIELVAPYSTGSVTLTNGSEQGTFSVAPSNSLAGWFLIPTGTSYPDVYQIASHTAGATAFELDAAFVGASGSSTFRAVKLDYELVPSYVVVDTKNRKLDFIANSVSNTVVTATLTAGSYTPSQFATHVATRLGTADTANGYSGSYDSDTRLFSITSNLVAANAVFRPITAGTNYYHSGWDTLGFGYANVASAATQTSTYILGGVTRLCSPARIYYGGQAGSLEQLDFISFNKDYPRMNLTQATPTHFTVIEENDNGYVVIRLNSYPDRAMRCEFDYIPTPKALQNNSASIPKLPQKYIQVLEYAAAYFVLFDKNDPKADGYFTLTQRQLRAMVKDNRKQLMQTGSRYGQPIARPEQRSQTMIGRTSKYGYDVGV